MKRKADPRRALAIFQAAVAAVIVPPASLSPSAWAAEHFVVPDGPAAGRTWDPLLTPYAVEILDQLSPESPVNRVVVKKSAQTGFTNLGMAWMGYVVANDPSKAMIIMPTIAAALDFNREKFNAAIEGSPILKERVRANIGRSAKGSTALNKKFPGGSIVITGANSSADLRSKTIKYMIRDEISDWPDDLEGQGDPLDMADARQLAFRETGDWKSFEISTPTVVGSCKITKRFEAGDQRYLHVPCPHCAEPIRLIFKHLKFEPKWPHQAHYECQECGGVVEHHHKRAMVRAGVWRATMPEPGRYPSYHFDTLTSLLVTWDDIAAAFLAAKDDPSKLKGFVTLWLGEAWEERGDSPDWQRLFARREDYPARAVPPQALFVTVMCDVQSTGIYFEAVAWGRDRQSWTIDAGFLDGPTQSVGEGAFAKLETVYAQTYAFGSGLELPADAFGVDAGYNSHVVYDWTRRRPRALALDGKPGWTHPPIGTPSRVDVNLAGKRLKRGALLWPTGTWSLKSTLYGELRKDGVHEGIEADPPGYCHFGKFCDERYFQQLTAEYLGVLKNRHGIAVGRKWIAIGANHFLDCRIGNMALAEHLGISRMGADDWARIAGQRSSAPGLQAAAAQPPVPESRTQVAEREEPRARPIKRQSGWLRR